MEKNTLSLCVICKNEEKNIKNLLESVKGSLFDEIIVCDSLPGYVPVVVRNKKTKIIDIIPLEDLFNVNINKTTIALKGEEVKECADLEVWVRYVKSRKGSWADVKNILRHPYSGEIIRINTVDGLIDTTPNHSLFALNGKTVDASKLKEGDEILLGELKNCHKSGKRGGANRIFCGTEELAWVYGFYAAEGSAYTVTCKEKVTYQTSLSNKNVKKLEFCKEILKKQLNIHSYISLSDSETSTYKLICGGLDIYNFFKDKFYTSGFEKKVPFEILNSPEKIRMEFLKGYYFGDGYKDIYTDSSCSKSWTLSQGILWLLYSLKEYSHNILIRDDKPNIIAISTNKGDGERRHKTLNLIKKIRKLDYSGFVYDLSTSIGKFQAGVGSIFAHNTGSTDKTVEIAKSYKVKVVHFDWINDFSAARNYSFSKATKNFQMWLDSDDIIKPLDYQKLLDLKQRLHESPIWLLKYEYAHDEYGNSICSFYRERIIKRSLNLKWQEPIHEYLPLNASYKKEDIEIHHFKQHASSDRNIPLLENIVKKNPNTARNVYYLGKELYDIGNLEKAIPHLERFITMPDAWGENKYSAFLKLISYYCSKKEYDKAASTCFKAIELEPLKADAYCLLGDVYSSNNQHNKAIHFYKIATITKRPENTLDVVEPKYFTWLPHLQLCVTYNSIGNVVEAAKHNEKALEYRPEDSRMLNNQKIFKNHLKEGYSTHLDYFAPVPKFSNNKTKFPKFDKKIGWYAPQNIDAGTIRIRVLNICKKLKDMGYASEQYNEANKDSYDFVVVGKSFTQNDLNFVKDLKYSNISVICDLSEDIVGFNYPFVDQIVKECDLVVCCSEELRKRVSLVNLNSICIEDAVDFILEE